MARLGVSQQQKEKRKADSRRQGQQVSIHVLRPQLAHEKQRHPADARGDRYQIAPAKSFFVEQRFHDQNVNRRGVLQKDRIRGGGQLGRHDKQEQQRGVKDRGDRADAVEAKAFTSRNNGDGDCGQKRAAK